jgi:hypothetical protein
MCAELAALVFEAVHQALDIDARGDRRLKHGFLLAVGAEDAKLAVVEGNDGH